MIGNYRDYPGTIKKRPSPAQIKQRHKWMMTGTLEGMRMRLTQLLSDKMIPHGRFRSMLANAKMSVVLAQGSLKEIELRLTEEQFIDLGFANSWEKEAVPQIALMCKALKHQLSSFEEGRCLTKYYCEICGYSYSVDSSD